VCNAALSAALYRMADLAGRPHDTDELIRTLRELALDSIGAES
jgi:hypothetical protein